MTAVFGGEEKIRISHLETCDTCTVSVLQLPPRAVRSMLACAAPQCAREGGRGHACGGAQELLLSAHGGMCARAYRLLRCSPCVSCVSSVSLSLPKCVSLSAQVCVTRHLLHVNSEAHE